MLRRIFRRHLWTSRLVAVELTLFSSTRLLSCLHLRHLALGEAIAKPWTLSAVKPAKRGAVLLMRRLGEVGAPQTLAASVEQAVENFFREPPPHHMDTLQNTFPMLKNKSKSSLSVGWSID